MKNTTIITLASFLCIITFFTSCENEDSEGNETKISRYYDNESHNTGQNCMVCHASGGKGEGWFIVAGSVYNSSKTIPYPNTTIKLYSEPNDLASLVNTIEVDDKGNFYTTEDVDFQNGLYASITDSNGSVINMNSIISSGQCNSCHGVTTDKIWIE